MTISLVSQQSPIDQMLTLIKVVGSGAGGGPLASRLAQAGQSVLLIESGDDQGTNYKYSTLDAICASII